VTIRIGELVAGDVFTDPNLANALAVLLVLVLLLPILVDQLLLLGDFVSLALSQRREHAG